MKGLEPAQRPGIRRKTAEFFNSFFDFGGGALAGGFYPVAAGGQARPPVNASTSLTGHINTPNSTLSLSAAWACVWLIADTISTLPFHLNRRTAPNLVYGAPATDLPLYQVLHDSPNQDMSACEFWQVMIACDLLWGNGYALKTRNSAGQVIALTPLRPEYTVPYRQLVPDSNPKKYVIRYKYYSPLETWDYSADEIFHLKDRTLDGLVGLSRIEYGRNSFGIARAAEDATAEVFRHGLRAGGFIQSDKFLKQEQRDMLRDDLRKFSQGGPEQGGMMVLEGGLKFESITMNPQDVQLLTSRQFAVEDVCRWFGVPPVLIGHAASGTTSWGTGIEQLLLGWLMLSLRPYAVRIQQACGRSLLTMPQRQTLYLHIDTGDLLAADATARGALYGNLAQNGIMTRNEIRAKEHMAPVVGADTLTVQSQLVPLDKLGEKPDPGPVMPQTVIHLPPADKPPPAPSKTLN